MLLIVLNTNYWSINAHKIKQEVTSIGNIQMKWLNQELTSAKENKQKVIIMGHIPPGYVYLCCHLE